MKLLKGGSSQQKPAVGNDQPQLPTQSGFFTPTEAIKTPPNDSPKSVTKQQQVMGPSELIELVKALTHREEKDKPKTKEAELIKLNNMPAPESYRTWEESCQGRSEKLLRSSRRSMALAQRGVRSGVHQRAVGEETSRSREVPHAGYKAISSAHALSRRGPRN